MPQGDGQLSVPTIAVHVKTAAAEAARGKVGCSRISCPHIVVQCQRQPRNQLTGTHCQDKQSVFYTESKTDGI